MKENKEKLKAGSFCIIYQSIHKCILYNIEITLWY